MQWLSKIYIVQHEYISAQSSQSIFAQEYLRECEDTYFILQNKYLHIYKQSFGAKILRDDCTLKLDPSLELFKINSSYLRITRDTDPT